MLIDWFTVAAQAVNFLVLVALLRWLLYDRIIAVMDRREEKISSRLEEAESKNEEAEKKVREYEERKNEIEEEKEWILEEAHEEAEEKRKKRLSEAREEVEETRAKWKESLRRDKESFLEELRSGAGRETVELTRTLLGKLAGSSLEACMVEKLGERLRDAGGEDREKIVEMLVESGERVLVRSAFELDETQRERVREILIELAAQHGEKDSEEDEAHEFEIDYETEEELICGIEIEAGGRKIGWSIDESLDGLREEFADLIEEHARERGNESEAEEEKEDEPVEGEADKEKEKEEGEERNGGEEDSKNSEDDEGAKENGKENEGGKDDR